MVIECEKWEHYYNPPWHNMPTSGADVTSLIHSNVTVFTHMRSPIGYKTLCSILYPKIPVPNWTLITPFASYSFIFMRNKFQKHRTLFLSNTISLAKYICCTSMGCLRKCVLELCNCLRHTLHT